MSQLLTLEILLFDLIFFYQKFLLFFFIFSNGFRQKFLITALSTGADPPQKKNQKEGAEQISAIAQPPDCTIPLERRGLLQWFL